MKKKILLFIVITFGWLCSFCQSRENDSKIFETRSSGIYKHYQDSYIATIISGKGYYPDYKGAKNSPYFRSNGLEFGTLIYEGIRFRNIEIQYDLYAQQVVVQLETKNDTQLVIIDSDKVSGFEINQYEFVNVRTDSVMNSGIYQVAYKGPNSNLFVKRRTDKDVELNHQEIIIEFLPKNDYYIKNDFGSFHIKSKKSLLKAYNNSSELISILKVNKIRFSKSQIESGLIDVLSLLDPKIAVN